MPNFVDAEPTAPPMIKNSKKVEKKKKNILVYGDTGSGKTTLFATLKGKKFAYLFDTSAIITLGGQDVDYAEFYPETSLGAVARVGKGGAAKGRDTKAPRRKEPTAYVEFEKHLEWMLEEGYKDYDVIGIKSLTMLSDICMDRISFLNGSYGMVPELGLYHVLGNTLFNICKALCALPCTIFFEGHTETMQNDLTKRIITDLDMTKAIRRGLPRLLSDAWIAMAEENEDKTAYFIQTQPDKEYKKAKTTTDLPRRVNVTVDFKKELEGQGIGGMI